MTKRIPLIVFIFLCLHVHAQTDTIPFANQAKKENRAKEYRSLLSSITSNLSLPLTDSTEENWQDAFNAMLLLQYKTAFADAQIRTAMNTVEYRSTEFQKSALELIYALYPKDFVAEITSLVTKTTDPKLFAMCSEYLFLNNEVEVYKPALLKRIEEIQGKGVVLKDPFLIIVRNKLLRTGKILPPISDLLNSDFLPNEMVVYSFQRKNRNYPGLVMVRGKDGLFIKDKKRKYFAVPQLARSSSNMPGYISNGNTPRGIFKIFGFAVSKGSAIGPTTNIQMVLPYENSTDVNDSVTRSLGDNYRLMLPVSWKNYFPFFEALYAGKAGRTEIIAHGTTINPVYYNKQPYYPISPTQGCLCTKEIWSTVNGKRMESDQQKLVDAVKKAGGANGYCVVIEIDDQQKPVALQDILSYIKQQ